MRIEEFEPEIAEVQAALDGEVVERDAEQDLDNDLWDSLWLLDDVLDLFEELTKDDMDIDMPLELQLKIFRLKDKITDHTEQWELRKDEK